MVPSPGYSYSFDPAQEYLNELNLLDSGGSYSYNYVPGLEAAGGLDGLYASGSGLLGSLGDLGWGGLAFAFGYGSCDFTYVPPPPPPDPHTFKPRTCSSACQSPRQPGHLAGGKAIGKTVVGAASKLAAATGKAFSVAAAGVASGITSSSFPLDSSAGLGITLDNPGDPTAGLGILLDNPGDPSAGLGQLLDNPSDPKASLASILSFPAILQGGQVLLSGTYRDALAASEVVNALHGGILDPRAAKVRSSSVFWGLDPNASGDDAYHLILSASQGLSPAQLAQALDWGLDIAPNRSGEHAESDGLAYIAERGWLPLAGAVDKNSCPSRCYPLLASAGATMIGPFQEGPRWVFGQRMFVWNDWEQWGLWAAAQE